MTKHQVTEEPDEAKVSRPVLKTSQARRLPGLVQQRLCWLGLQCIWRCGTAVICGVVDLDARASRASLYHCYVNRLEMLPAELVRRFDDIFFGDLPHEGARYEVFYLHLAKYFPVVRDNNSPWSDDQWRRLLTEYRICSPAEIGNAVRRCAESAFYQGRPEQIEFEDLLKQLQEFTPAMKRESEQIQAIRNQAIYAKPVASQDVSRFAYQHRELFG